MSRLALPGLVCLALLCLIMAFKSYGIQAAYFDSDPTAPARAGTTSSGLSAEGVLWLVGAIAACAAAVAVAVRRRKR